MRSAWMFRAKQFREDIHVTDQGEILFYKGISDKLKYLVTESINDNLLEIPDIPPVRQAEVFVDLDQNWKIILITQAYQMIVLEEVHPSGITLDLPPIKRLFITNKGIYVLDLKKRLSRLFIPEWDWTSVSRIVIIDNIKIIQDANEWMVITTENNQLIVERIKDLSSSSQLTELDKEIRKINLPLIFYEDNSISLITFEDKTFHIEHLITPDYPFRDAIYSCGKLYILDDQGNLR